MGSRPLRALPAGGGGGGARLVARRAAPGESAAQLVVLDPRSSDPSKPLVLDTGAFTGFGRIAVAGGTGGAGAASLAVVAAQPTAPAALVEASLNLSSPSSAPWSVVAKSSDLAGIEGFVSTPRVVKFPTGKKDGKEFAYL